VGDTIYNNVQDVDALVGMDTEALAAHLLEHLNVTGLVTSMHSHPGNLGIMISNHYGQRKDEIQRRVHAACKWLLNHDYLEEVDRQGFFQLSKKGEQVKSAAELLGKHHVDLKPEAEPQLGLDPEKDKITTLDIFISHSSQDVDIAELLIELLRAALNIPVNRIRCTSIRGYKLRAGASTDESLRKEVHNSRVLIGLITSASLQSA
jgi:hypothetical protein